MQSSRLGYRIWVLAIYLMTTSLKGVCPVSRLA